ncbi:unnamed protein product [Allacma fusca]|uniref:Uncharacterized protein n=1 Tax=Allacma fusca TaxID=39272 RepID=A0A8J2NT62_9HEXA|nr:unnamed protein product [Allacma fusca]
MSNKWSPEEKWEVLQELQEAKSNYKSVFEEAFPDENRDVYGDEDTNPINDTAKNLQFILDNEITADEAKHAIKCLPKRKAVGTDSTPNEVYMNLDPTTLCYLAHQFNQHNYQAFYVNDVSSHRGHFCAIGEILSDNQCAYRRGRGCCDQVFNLYALICKQLSVPKGKLFAIFMDLASLRLHHTLEALETVKKAGPE